MKNVINLIDDLASWQKEFKAVLNDKKMDVVQRDNKLAEITGIIEGIQQQIIESYRSNKK